MTRKWFQLHLSTVVVLVLVAGSLLALNLIRDLERVGHYYAEVYGWPLAFRYDDGLKKEFRTVSLAINAAVALAALSAAGMGCELLTRRRLYRLHLSTAVIMMFVAAGLIWANTAPGLGQIGNTPISGHRGWPTTMQTYWLTDPTDTGWFAKSVLLNLAAFILIQFFTAASCELFIRRREAQKP